MADTFRYKYGDTKPVVSNPAASATVIEIGDLLFQQASDGNNPKPASDIGAIGDGGHANLAAAQEAFHDEFLGVAISNSPSGNTDAVTVATGGVFEFPCASATFAIDTLVGPTANGGGTALLDQQLIAVATPNLAVGRVAKDYPSATTKILVEIVATVSHGGPQAMA